MRSKVLEYFIGKVCTIFTGPINRTFQEQQLLDYFVGVVDAVDENGILMTHTITGAKNFYFFPNILSISEEQLLDPADPEDAKMIEEIKKSKQGEQAKTPPPPPPVKEDVHETEVNESPFVDVSAIHALAQRAKQSFGKK